MYSAICHVVRHHVIFLTTGLRGGDEEFLNLSAAPFLPRLRMPTILNVAPAITIVVIDADDDVEQEENMSMMMREEEEEGIVKNYSQW